MKTRILFSFILLTSIFSACKKEGPSGPAGPPGSPGVNGIGSPDPNIYNKWQVISGLPNTKYVIIKSDNSYFQLDSNAYGFKNLSSDAALITGSQIACFNLFNYIISNDTLTLVNLYGTVILKKNTNAPDETQWVLPFTEIDSIASPVTNGDGREDLGFDGTNILWTADASSNAIYKINPTTHSVAGTVPLTNTYYYGQVNYAAANIWISNNATVDKVNPSNGNVISTSPTLTTVTGPLTGMALAGQNLWYCDWQGNISTWDIISNAITPQLQYRTEGMEYVNGYLYMTKGNKIYKCELSPTFKVVASYAGDNNASYQGITYDGSHFWVVKYNYNQNNYSLVKLSI
ncbi:MAG: hypothetical protein ABIQ40_00670 [Bacteroidia bacterium]